MMAANLRRSIPPESTTRKTGPLRRYGQASIQEYRHFIRDISVGFPLYWEHYRPHYTTEMRPVAGKNFCLLPARLDTTDALKCLFWRRGCVGFCTIVDIHAPEGLLHIMAHQDIRNLRGAARLGRQTSLHLSL